MSFARVYCVGVWFGFVRSALLLAVVTYIVLSFEAMLGVCCFLRVTLVTHESSHKHTTYRVPSRSDYAAADSTALACRPGHTFSALVDYNFWN